VEEISMRRSRAILTALALGLATLASACGPSTTDDGEDPFRLSLAGPAQIELLPGESVDLAWLLIRPRSGAQFGHTIAFTVVSAASDHGCTLAQPSGTTDEHGLAGTTFQAGPEALTLPLQVQGAATTIPAGATTPPPVSFTITVADPLRILRPEPPDVDRYEGLTGGRVTLAVRASTGEFRPLAGEDIAWEVTEAGGGGARFAAPTTQTDLRGVAWAELECGSAATTVTAQATLAGTAPVVFTISVSEFGSCDGTHPCPTGWDCQDGGCVQQAPECTDDETCAEGERCRFGECVTASGDGDSCKLDEECDPGETCVAGVCTGCESPDVDCPCETVDACPEGFLCVEGECVCEGVDCGGDPPGCEIDDPDLAGFWEVDSNLHLRESLPDWLEGLLDATDGVFRFLSEGILGGFDFDIPIIGDVLEDAADSLVAEYVPPWVGELLGAIADVSDILADLHVMQDMDLWGAGTADQYEGNIEWTEVEMTWRGEDVRGRFDDITGVSVSHEGIEAEAICGTFYLHRHDIALGVGMIVRWVLDVIVTAVSEGEYWSLEDLLYSLTDYCVDLAYAIDDLAQELADGLDISLPDVYDLALGVCEAGITAGTDSLIDWLEDLTIETDAMTLAGQATVTSSTQLDDGRWDGTLLGGDFTGEFTAVQR
jgi:hypothetical protein